MGVSKNKTEKINNDYMAIIYTNQNYLNCITYPRTTCPIFIFVSLLLKMVMYLMEFIYITQMLTMLCTPNESLSAYQSPPISFIVFTKYFIICYKVNN